MTALSRLLLAAGVLTVISGWASPGSAQVVQVGSFLKSTVGGAQVVPHTLGTPPTALVLWTNRSAGGFLYAFGMTDGTTSRSVSMASQTGVNPSNTSRRIAAKALSIVRWGEVVVAEADLTAWSATSFTLTWTTNDGTPDTIHYMAIGGSAVQAKVVDWTMPAAAGPVSVVTGFTPDVVLHAHAGYDLSGALPVTAAGAWFGLGVMDWKDGPPGATQEQWAFEVGSVDNVSPSDTQRARDSSNNFCLYAIDNAQATQKQATFSSMDATGFTVTFGTVVSPLQGRVVSLALKGVSVKVGSDTKVATNPSVPAFVAGQTAYKNAAAGSTATVTLPAASTAGNLVVLSFDVPSQALNVLSVRDNNGNTYRLATAPRNWNGAANRMYTYYASDVTGGAAITITVTLDGATAAAWNLYAVEYSGVAPSDPVGRRAASTGNGTTWSSGTATTNSPDELVYGFCMTTGSGTPTVPLTRRNTAGTANFVADRTVSSIGNYAVTGTAGAAAPWGCQMVAFKAGQSFTFAGMNDMTPAAVLLASTVTGSGGAATEARFTLGAADRALHQGVSAVADQNGVATTNVWGTDSTTSVFIKNNAGPPIEAQAAAASVDVDGFTLDWTLNDAPQTRFMYLVLGDVVGPVGAGCTPTGANFVQHGTFDAAPSYNLPTKTEQGNNFQTGAQWVNPAAFPDTTTCLGDTQSTIANAAHLCNGGLDAITLFPGDPTFGVAAAPKALTLNGNNMWGGAVPYLPNLYWRQNVTGLTANKTYTFYLYASNANNPTVAWPTYRASLRFCKGVTATNLAAGTGPYACVTQLNAVDFSIPNELAATGDVWRRYQVTFTTGPGETSADLAVLDTVTNTGGDDVQITALGVQACTPTAVKLMSFEASGLDGAVDLSWRTGSEVDNLGFHLYRSPSADGPWSRLTGQLIPGKGFSAMGASYSWRDTGLANGTRYYYKLEDVDTKSISTFHGPVSAIPQAGAEAPPAEGGGSSSGGSAGGGSGTGGPGSNGSSSGSSGSCPAWALAQLGASASSYTCESHGDTASSSFRILSRSAGSALVELETAGFLTARDASGRVRALLPGFDTVSDPLAPALPLKRAVLDGVVGRQARIRTIDARENRFFSGLPAAAVGYPQAVVSRDGTVRAGRREAELGLSRGAFPRVQVRLAGEGFQGEDKTLALELMPLRYDASRRALVLSRRLTVRIDFAGTEVSEVGRGRLGRRVPRSRPDSNAYAFLATSRKGLHAVSFESVFPGRSRPLDASLLRLSRDGGRVLVPFHILPEASQFAPGSRLLFLADTLAPSTSFSSEVVYALERGTGGVRMNVLPAPVDASAPAFSKGFGEWEASRYFIADVLDAGDLWQWESLAGGGSTTKTFPLDGLDSSSSETAHLVVSLQGGSDAVAVVDHHVQVFVGNALVAETTFDGAVPHEVEAEVPLYLLQASTNELRIFNVGDTGVYSRVLLDRFEIAYPQTTGARSGVFDGRFASGGTAEVSGLVSPSALVDATSGSWLSGFDAGSSLRFHAEADHRYLAVSQEALLLPRVFFPEPSARLRSAANQADYLLIAPQAFLPAAQPLLDRRASQGLTTFAASLEEITSAFGAGQPSGEALRDFLSFAYHQWTRPSLRYVLLLGDSNYDPRHFSAYSQPSPLPYLLQKTSYMWTGSDPALAALNGDDLLPDLAIGRLPATTLEQAQTLVAKVLDWEDQGQNLEGKVALVADNPDPAGDFEADLRDIEFSFLTGRETTEILYSQIGDPSTARAEILDAMNSGLSVISYVGHGGGGLWASENILNSGDVKSLLAQPRQPFMLTMNCLNGYFIAPSYESLAEGFLKGSGKGTIAAFSPSGLSLDGPAHLYHRAVWQEITSGQHERLGDAILAAQKTYAQTGAFPELLSLYHLLGDPALKLR